MRPGAWGAGPGVETENPQALGPRPQAPLDSPIRSGRGGARGLAGSLPPSHVPKRWRHRCFRVRDCVPLTRRVGEREWRFARIPVIGRVLAIPDSN